MAGLRVHFVMPQELVERIDAALPEGVSRGEFVRRAVERALGPFGEADDMTIPSVGGPAPAEQPRVRANTHAETCKCSVCS